MERPREACAKPLACRDEACQLGTSHFAGLWMCDTSPEACRDVHQAHWLAWRWPWAGPWCLLIRFCVCSRRWHASRIMCWLFITSRSAVNGGFASQ